MLEIELPGVTSPRGDKSRVDVGRFLLFFTHPGLQLLLLGHSWALLGRLWVLLGHSGAFLGHSRALLGCPWVPLGRLWDAPTLEKGTL